jgi:hypothetical protein
MKATSKYASLCGGTVPSTGLMENSGEKAAASHE